MTSHCASILKRFSIEKARNRTTIPALFLNQNVPISRTLRALTPQSHSLRVCVGFSLIELLIVLSIIIVLLTITIPSQNIFFNKTQDQIMSAQLFRAIQLTRSEAMVRGTSVTLRKSGEWKNGYLIAMNEKPLFVFNNPNNNGVLHWRAFPKNREDLQFLPTGATHSENGTFWYCQKNHIRWAIVISQSGRVRMVHPDKNGKVAVEVKC